MRLQDVPHVAALDPLDPATRWEPEDYLAVLSTPGGEVWLAEAHGRVVASLALVVTPEPRHVELLNVAVAPLWRRRGLGRALLEHLARDRPGLIQATVPESNLPAQLLLRVAGYRAVRVLRGYFGTEDGYLLELPGPVRLYEPPAVAAAEP
jgi:ribosomal-protein-alanine N-acetyltransferase